ncbi:MAG: hypothetical protein IJJ26_12530 [Victivallales bacterium]|nr:hypothetical protein [Victivallales bacterium]
MLAEMLISEALQSYTLIVMGVLVVVLLAGVFYERAHNWQLSRLRLRTCKQCGLVFAVGRFQRRYSNVICPRCQCKLSAAKKEKSK